MEMLFGMYLDGSEWSNNSASIGEIRTGPQGLVGIIETRLGFSKPLVHPVYRIDAYMQRIKEIDQESSWFHESFTADPWSTSRQLLKWRDELAEAGWSDKVNIDTSQRLNFLYKLEKINIPLPEGWPERLREIINYLDQNIPIHISSINLIEPITMLPPVWQHLLKLLQNQGTIINNPQECDIKNPDSNLKSVQAFLQEDNVKMSLSAQDDSLILLQAENEWEAAEHLALWLASDPEQNNEVTIICGRDTTILDEALRRYGLPCIGRTEPSRFREIQQILPLLLSNIWQPIDIHLLAELLSLNTSPFPKYVCRYLMEAISQEPGINGRAWKNALNDIAAAYKQKLIDKDDPLAEEKTEVFIKDIQSFLVEDRYEPTIGIPEDKLREHCQKIIDWFGWQLEDDSMLVEIIGHAREIQKLSIGKGNIQRNILERMLDTVIGAGTISEDNCEEVSLWHVVDHPGQIVDSCNQLIWWGFNDPMISMPAYWSDKERSALESSGIYIEKTSDFRKREAHSWQQGFTKAQKRFIAYYFEQEEGAESPHHPFWDTICYAASQIGNCTSEEASSCLIKKCKDYDNKAEWSFAGRKQTLESVEKEERNEPIWEYSIPSSISVAPKRLSYSQMSTLTGCPLKWSLQYFANICLSKSRTIPSGSQMIGTFCHRIVEELFSDPSKQWAAEDAYKESEKLFDLLLPSMASELMLEGNAIEKLRYRSAISEAVRQLVLNVNRINLKVEKTEAYLEAIVNDIPFVGYADLLLRDIDGHPYVLDLKWTGSKEYRKQEIKDGLSLQLASYAWMLKYIESVQKVHTGYFMLSQGLLLSDSTIMTDDAIDSVCTLDEVWKMGVASINDIIEKFNRGIIEARGVMEAIEGKSEEKEKNIYINEYRSKGMLYQFPPCRFCDYALLCGLPEVANE